MCRKIAQEYLVGRYLLSVTTILKGLCLFHHRSLSPNQVVSFRKGGTKEKTLGQNSSPSSQCLLYLLLLAVSPHPALSPSIVPLFFPICGLPSLPEALPCLSLTLLGLKVHLLALAPFLAVSTSAVGTICSWHPE